MGAVARGGKRLGWLRDSPVARTCWWCRGRGYAGRDMAEIWREAWPWATD